MCENTLPKHGSGGIQTAVFRLVSLLQRLLKGGQKLNPGDHIGDGQQARHNGGDKPPVGDLHAAAEAYNVSIALLEDAFQNMKPLKIEILADTLSLSKKDMVDVVVFGEKGLDLSKAKKESFVFGITYPDPNVDVNLKRAKATKMALKDVNGDGVKDLVLTFPSDEAAKYGFEGVNTDLWLFGEIDGQKKGGFDLVRIVK